LVIISDVNNYKKTKPLLGLKNRGKNPPKQEILVFLEKTVHRLGEKAENQRKTRENQGEIQGSRKPGVLFGYLCQ
jgi:hypothetical protein